MTPEPGFPIDNPYEVIAAMRDEDFRQSYVLNVKLVDCLLSDQSRNPKQTQKLFEYLSSEFESCEAFLDAYYASGSHVAELTSGLAERWRGFVPTAIASSRNITHITQLVASLPKNLLRMLAKDFAELPAFVSSNLSEILEQAPELEPERLKCLDFEVKEFAAIKGHPEVLSVMFEAGLFELTITNLEYVYQRILGEDDLKPLREGNFTAIRSTNNSVLLERVERDFETYVRNVLLELPENSKEGAAAIVDLVRHEALDQEDLRKFLERQTSLLPSLDDVPEKLHAMLFKLSMIEPTWVNCLVFLRSNGFDAETLVEYFDRDDVRSALLKHPIPDDSDSKQLRLFLFEAGSLSDAAYKDYAHSLPDPINFIPDGLEQSKLSILIGERKVTFTTEILEALSGNRDLQVAFVATNIDIYLADPGSFALDDWFREELLQADIDQDAKRETVKLMDLTVLVDLPERSARIGPIINNADVNSFSLDGSVAQSLIEHSRPIATQISLLNKCHYLMTDDEVRHVLTKLPSPFCEIKTGYGVPRLRNNPENLALVKWLDSRDIISSWSEGSLFSNDIRVNLYRS